MRSDREDAWSMATAGATANTTEDTSRASRESGMLCSHSHGESIVIQPLGNQGCCVHIHTGNLSLYSPDHPGAHLVS